MRPLVAWCQSVVCIIVELDAKRSCSRLLLISSWRASSDGRQAATPLLLLLRHVITVMPRQRN